MINNLTNSYKTLRKTIFEQGLDLTACYHQILNGTDLRDSDRPIPIHSKQNKDLKFEYG